jgi:hypothetical protein
MFCFESFATHGASSSSSSNSNNNNNSRNKEQEVMVKIWFQQPPISAFIV